MERRQHHLQAITSQLKIKGTIGKRGYLNNCKSDLNQRGFKVEKERSKF
jgi:hypothetical protein